MDLLNEIKETRHSRSSYFDRISIVGINLNFLNMELNMKNVIYIIAALAAVVLFVMDKDLEYVSGAIFFILTIYSKYVETQAKKSEEKAKKAFEDYSGMSVEEFREMK